MGNPKPLPVYWDKILINASQATNPPIDPLREPMETRVFLGKKPKKIERDKDGKIKFLVVGGSIRSAADVVKAIALGADACYIATAALLALGCHLCRTCQSGKCNWGIATQRPELVKRLNPDMGSERLINLMNAWRHEIKELMGGTGINSIESLKGNRLMLRGVGLTGKELEILLPLMRESDKK